VSALFTLIYVIVVTKNIIIQILENVIQLNANVQAFYLDIFKIYSIINLVLSLLNNILGTPKLFQKDFDIFRNTSASESMYFILM
jgi:hypothetical protein